MSVYNVHAGHNKIVPGASKYLDEVTENRKVKNLIIQYLRENGDTVYDCTDDTGTTQSKILSNIVKKCNKHKANLDLSIHLNAGGGTGTEAYYVSEDGKKYAEKISAAMAKALQIKNRGAKKSTNLYVLNHTKAPAVLIECCFTDHKTDFKNWDAEQCAVSIVEAITGKKQNESNPGNENSFLVRINGVKKGDVLNIRENASASSKITKTLPYDDKNQYTILMTKKNGSDLWGQLKSGIGWINLKYTKKI